MRNRFGNRPHTKAGEPAATVGAKHDQFGRPGVRRICVKKNHAGWIAFLDCHGDPNTFR
jgi:hypothetical protein